MGVLCLLLPELFFDVRLFPQKLLPGNLLFLRRDLFQYDLRKRLLLLLSYFHTIPDVYAAYQGEDDRHQIIPGLCDHHERKHHDSDEYQDLYRMDPPFARSQFIDHPLVLRILLLFGAFLLYAVADLLRNTHILFLKPVDVPPYVRRLLLHLLPPCLFAQQ